MAAKLPVTQRAYTLRLRGTDKNDSSWQDKLWKTHEAVNKGAKAFGDWLLTMRGGLSYELVDMKVKTKNSGREPNDDEKRDRRILLALSWLSVESKAGAPENYIVPHTVDTKTGKIDWKTKYALCNILQLRGLDETDIKKWVEDCIASLSAAIRDDAVWVNRSKAFDEAKDNDSFAQIDIWDFLNPFFSNQEVYLRPIKQQNEESDEFESSEEKEKDLVQRSGQWLSSRFGTGKGADFSKMKEVYDAIASWASTATPNQSGQEAIVSLAQALSTFNPAANDLQGVLGLISGPGYKSATRNRLQKIYGNGSVTQNDLDQLNEISCIDSLKCIQKRGNKGRRNYADKVQKDVEASCGFTYLQNSGPARHSEFAVLLDHAARRVSLAHTWIKLAEAERLKFEEDAHKLSGVPQSAKEWLDAFCEERSGTSGAIDGYRIRKRAADGWKEIVKAWSRPGCITEDDRIAAARILQDDPEIEKFGDIQLFEALAIDEAKCVWQQNGNFDVQILLDYVAATDAEAKKRRFKVPAYRHPDALLHPIFCDFGNSRWDIEFDIHKYTKKSKKTSTVNIHGLKMGLLDGNDIKKTGLQWSSKLLTADLAFKQNCTGNTVDVSRASRLGRAARSVETNAAVSIAGLFDQKDWNGRLQAPREQLEAIKRQQSPTKAASMCRKIKWLITFSPRLQQQGPWVDYAENFDDDAPAKPFVSRKGEYAVKHKDNNSRKGYAKLILSRLPGLRVLSVDLGHRYAAACAVWETFTNEQVKKACNKADCKEPFANAMYLPLKSKDQNGKDKTTIYRRIGPDTLNGSNHPAPWARLDRQFLIRLQGEAKSARKASPAEIEAFCKLERDLGRKALEPRSFQADDLMSDAVNTIRLALKRHADRARIAHYLITDEKTLPGGKPQKLDEQGRVDLITDALELWHALATGNQWEDKWAENFWNEQTWKNDVPLTKRDIEDKTRQQIKKKKEELRSKLKPVAEKLAKQDNMKLHSLWATRWRDDDAIWKKRLRWLRDWIMPRGSANSSAIRNVGGLSLIRIATIKSLYQVQKAFFTRFTPTGRQMKNDKPVTAGEGFGQRILDAMENMREQRVKQLASRIVEAALGVGRIKISKNGKDPKRPFEQVDAPCHAVVIENLTHYRPEETRTRRENRQLMTWSSSKVKKYLSEGCQLHGLHLREVPAGYTSRQDSRTGAPGIRCEDVPVRDFLESPFWIKEVNRAEQKQEEKKGGERNKYLLDLKKRWAKECTSTCSIRIPSKGGDIFVSADKNSPAAKGLQADLNAAANIGIKALLDPDWPGKWWYVVCELDNEGWRIPMDKRCAGAECLKNWKMASEDDSYTNDGKPLSLDNDASVGLAEEEYKKIKAEWDTAKKIARKSKAGEHAKKQEEQIKKTYAEAKKKLSGAKKAASAKANLNLWRDVSSRPLIEGKWLDYSHYQNVVQRKAIEILRNQSNLNE